MNRDSIVLTIGIFGAIIGYLITAGKTAHGMELPGVVAGGVVCERCLDGEALHLSAAALD